MEILIWKPIDRKRQKDISYNSPEFNKGYDLDMVDFTALVGKYNAKSLTNAEENRLYMYIMTMMNIVLENPKVNPKKYEMDDLTDLMFMDGWKSLKYIKEGTKPYSYIYHSMYIAVCKYYKKVVKDRERKEQLESWIDEAYAEYKEAIGDGKVRCMNKDE